MGRDFSKELNEHHKKREENRLANEKAMNERRANALKGLEERPDLKPHYEAELEAIKKEQVNWENAQNTTADKKQREIVSHMAFSEGTRVATVNLGSDHQAATASNVDHIVDAPQNDETPKQLTYGQARLDRSRAAANDDNPKEKGSEPET